MRLLLDTHIWLWCLGEPQRLSRRVVRELESAESELWLSPISAWELLVLVETGRVALGGEVDAWLEDAAARLPLREAPITH